MAEAPFLINARPHELNKTVLLMTKINAKKLAN